MISEENDVTEKTYFMTVQRQKKFQTVLVEDFDSRIKESHCQQFTVGAVSDR